MKYKYKGKERKAIKDSIIHWTKDYRKLDLFGGRMQFGIFGGGQCECCKTFKTPMCEGCPLISCTTDYDYWKKTKRAYYNKDKKAFLRARKGILDILKAALKERI